MTDLIELAARVEGLAGPDREVDAAVAAAVRAGLPVGCDWAFKFPKWEGAPNKTGAVRVIGNVNGNGDYIAGNFQSPIYTASLDAAMTLVPEGFDWMVDNFDGSPSRWCSANVLRLKIDARGEAATPAIALCSAALKARSRSLAGREA